MTPEQFLEMTKRGKESQSFKLGTIPLDYVSGNPKVIFDGETVASVKAYPATVAVSPLDRVILAYIGHTWLVIGVIGGSGGGSTTASGVSIADIAGNFDASNVEGALAELFTNVSSGKTLLETAITDKGGTVSKAGSIATFAELDTGIRSIPPGGASGVVSMSGATSHRVEVTGLSFQPSLVILDCHRGTKPTYDYRRVYMSIPIAELLKDYTTWRDSTGSSGMYNTSSSGDIITSSSFSLMIYVGTTSAVDINWWAY